MRVGYACQCLNNAIPSFRTCIQKYVNEALLMELITHNLKVLDQILDYNFHQSILVFRLSSDLIPFGSSPVNTIDWQTIFQKDFQALGEKARKYGMRLSMHPGQYTILNTPREDVLERSILDLRYHCDILNLMEMDMSNKLILHVGGVYGNKEEAMARFTKVFLTLEDDIKKRLVIENDDHYYTLEDVLALSNKLQIPVVFDNLHHDVLPSFIDVPIQDVLKLVKATWKKEDGRMKMHYSQQDEAKRKGAHAIYLDGEAFMRFCKSINFMDIDVMIEVKSKNLAAMQANELLDITPFCFENTWKRYRYLILNNSLAIFNKVEKTTPELSAQMFYALIYQALTSQEENYLGCYQRILEEWYPRLDEKTSLKLQKVLARYQEGKLSLQGVRNAFYAISNVVDQEDSYLFL